VCLLAGSGENVPVCYRPDKPDCPAKKGIFEGLGSPILHNRAAGHPDKRSKHAP
jgi:hypothetical protein